MVDILQMRIWLNLDILVQPLLVSALFPAPAASLPEETPNQKVVVEIRYVFVSQKVQDLVWGPWNKTPDFHFEMALKDSSFILI